MMQEATIRRLGPEDWQAFRALRLDGLQREPENFGACYEDEAGASESFWRGRLDSAIVFGASDAAVGLLGVGGIYVLPGLNVRHKAHLFGMYVLEAGRGRGVGRRLCQAAIEAARALPAVEQLQATVRANNEPAVALYRSLGFVQWGLEPCGTKTPDGRCSDDARLVLTFD